MRCPVTCKLSRAPVVVEARGFCGGASLGPAAWAVVGPTIPCPPLGSRGHTSPLWLLAPSYPVTPLGMPDTLPPPCLPVPLPSCGLSDTPPLSAHLPSHVPPVDSSCPPATSKRTLPLPPPTRHTFATPRSQTSFPSLQQRPPWPLSSTLPFPSLLLPALVIPAVTPHPPGLLASAPLVIPWYP